MAESLVGGTVIGWSLEEHGSGGFCCVSPSGEEGQQGEGGAF